MEKKVTQLVQFNIAPHSRSILGRDYAPLFLEPATHQLQPSLRPLTYNEDKGLEGRPKDKMDWAVLVASKVDFLSAYEAHLSGPPEEQPPPENPADPSALAADPEEDPEAAEAAQHQAA